MTIDPDRMHQVGIAQIEGRGVADPVRILKFTTQGDRQAVVLGFPAVDRPIDRATDRKELLAAGQFDELRQDNAGRTESGVDIPDRASTAVLCKLEGGRIEALRHVSGFVDA